MKRNCMTFIPRLPFLNRSSWIVGCVLAIVCACFPFETWAQTAAIDSITAQLNAPIQNIRDAKCKIVYLGIVGGLETSNNSRSGVVQIQDTLRDQSYSDVCAKSFSPYVWPVALHWVLKHFPAHSGSWTNDELADAPKSHYRRS